MIDLLVNKGGNKIIISNEYDLIYRENRQFFFFFIILTCFITRKKGLTPFDYLTPQVFTQR